MNKLFPALLAALLCVSASGQSERARAAKFAADALGIPPAEALSRVAVGLSGAVPAVDGVSASALQAAAEAAGVSIPAPVPVIVAWDLPIPEPTAAELAAVEDASAVFEPEENLEYVGNKWRRKSPAALEELKQSKKPAGLRAAERKLIDFLRAEGAVAADALSATPEQIDAMYEAWEATLNDAQIQKKSTRYTRLLERVERAGGTESGAYRHAE